MKINLSEIRIDGGTQSRAGLNEEVVAEYTDAYKAGVRMPDVSLFYDGSVYWLADGFHRYAGAKQAGKTSIDAETKAGSQRDAWLYSLGANADHGLRRTNADKRKAVGAALADLQLGQWSSRQIAEQCNVSHVTVDRMRHEQASLAQVPVTGERVFTTKHGTESVMKTAQIGRAPPKVEPTVSDEPEMGEEVDLLAMLEEMQKELDGLHKLNAKLAATDRGAELAKAIAAKEYAENEQGKAMNQAVQWQKECKSWQTWWAKVVSVLNIEKRSEVLDWIKSKA